MLQQRPSIFQDCPKMSQDRPKMALTWPEMVQDVCVRLSRFFFFGCLWRSLAMPYFLPFLRPSLYHCLPSPCLRFAFALLLYYLCTASPLPLAFEWGAPLSYKALKVLIWDTCVPCKALRGLDEALVCLIRPLGTFSSAPCRIARQPQLSTALCSAASSASTAHPQTGQSPSSQVCGQPDQELAIYFSVEAS